MKIFVIHDAKAKSFLLPFFCQNEEIAIRHFAFAANDPSCDIGKYQSDFTLHCMGEYDEVIGKITPEFPLVFLALASSLIKA